MEGMCLSCSSVCNINDTRDVYIQDNNSNNNNKNNTECHKELGKPFIFIIIFGM